MEKLSKFSGFVRVFRLLGGFYFLLRAWALAVILIACVPPRCDWHAYCLAIGMPLLLISLALSVWQAVWAGTEIAYYTEEDENGGRHE